MNKPSISALVRAHLQDYVLLITRLNSGVAVQSTEEIQRLATDIIHAFDQRLLDEQVSERERLQAKYALCALADEAALRFLNEYNRRRWEARPLQVVAFGDYAAGEQLFETIQAELHSPEPSQWLLAVWQLMFALGFNGRYLFTDPSQKQALISIIDQKLPPEQASVSALGQRMGTIHWRSFSPLSWCVGLLLGVLGLYWGLANYLDHFVARIIG
ncbi:MAG: DotU/TssL family secretion system protein [Neisseriaceae bacterium]|nr:DotU/TssL family secretion system protein [Neisseriaceae bacterium]